MNSSDSPAKTGFARPSDAASSLPRAEAASRAGLPPEPAVEPCLAPLVGPSLLGLLMVPLMVLLMVPLLVLLMVPLLVSLLVPLLVVFGLLAGLCVDCRVHRLCCPVCWRAWRCCWRLRKVWRRSGATGWSTLSAAALTLLGDRGARAERRSFALRPCRPAFCDLFEDDELDDPWEDPLEEAMDELDGLVWMDG